MYSWGRHRRGKYDAKPTVVDGIRFHSKKEAKRYGELKLLVLAGLIDTLELQPKFPLKVNGILITTYIGDFRYRLKEDGAWRSVVEDAKGFRTREYRLKKKLLLALHGIEVREV